MNSDPWSEWMTDHVIRTRVGGLYHQAVWLCFIDPLAIEHSYWKWMNMFHVSISSWFTHSRWWSTRHIPPLSSFFYVPPLGTKGHRPHPFEFWTPDHQTWWPPWRVHQRVVAESNDLPVPGDIDHGPTWESFDDALYSYTLLYLCSWWVDELMSCWSL